MSMAVNTMKWTKLSQMKTLGHAQTFFVQNKNISYPIDEIIAVQKTMFVSVTHVAECSKTCNDAGHFS